MTTVVRGGSVPPAGFGWVYTCQCGSWGLIPNSSGSIQYAAAACLAYDRANVTCGGIVNPHCDTDTIFSACISPAFACGAKRLPLQCNLVRLPPTNIAALTSINVLAFCLILFGFGAFCLSQWLRDNVQRQHELEEMPSQVSALNSVYHKKHHPHDASSSRHRGSQRYERIGENEKGRPRRPGFGFVRGRLDGAPSRRWESTAVDTMGARSARAFEIAAGSAIAESAPGRSTSDGRKIYVAANDGGDDFLASENANVVVRAKSGAGPLVSKGSEAPASDARPPTTTTPVAHSIPLDRANTAATGGGPTRGTSHGKTYIQAGDADRQPPVVEEDTAAGVTDSRGKVYVRGDAVVEPAEPPLPTVVDPVVDAVGSAASAALDVAQAASKRAAAIVVSAPVTRVLEQARKPSKALVQAVQTPPVEPDAGAHDGRGKRYIRTGGEEDAGVPEFALRAPPRTPAAIDAPPQSGKGGDKPRKTLIRAGESSARPGSPTAERDAKTRRTIVRVE